jgi:DivIVA domain-containing protein
VAENEPATTADATPESAPATPEEETAFLKVRDRVPAELRNVSFPVSMRGYDRAAVEAYVQRVNRVIAELEVSRSPQAAIRHALDRVGEQTVAILREARESAERIAVAARDDADQTIQEAKAEAADLVVNASADAEQERAAAKQTLADAQAEANELVSQARAEAEGILADARGEAERRQQQTDDEIEARQAKAEARLRELESDAHAVSAERDALVEQLHSIGSRLHEVANSAGAQAPTGPDTTPAEESPAGTGTEADDTIIVEPRH